MGMPKYKNVQKIEKRKSGRATSGKKHPDETLPSQGNTTCPYCKKKYTYLEPMLIRLDLKTTKNSMWTIPMPAESKNQADQEIWKLLHQKNTNIERTQREIPRENRTKEQRGKENKNHTNAAKKQHTGNTSPNTIGNDMGKNTVRNKTANRQATMQDKQLQQNICHQEHTNNAYAQKNTCQICQTIRSSSRRVQTAGKNTKT